MHGQLRGQVHASRSSLFDPGASQAEAVCCSEDVEDLELGPLDHDQQWIDQTPWLLTTDTIQETIDVKKIFERKAEIDE